MKLVKVVFAAAALLVVSGPAMASVGDFRSNGEELREGQLICPKVAEAALKKAAAAEGQFQASDASREVASAHSAN
ncbi:MAG: hypothetical protein ACXWQO_02230 [Bdellovibrionota bacterium]